jgi:hypothetical protein
MSWNLKIVPRGLLLSKYAKNIILVNPNNVKDVASNSLLSDNYQTFNQSNNTANLIFQLDIFNLNPQNEEVTPTISGISYIKISNDPTFEQAYILTPTSFTSAYDYNTNYSLNLSNYDVVNTFLPNTQSVTFATSSGLGNIEILNWPLSGSSGSKKVFFAISVTLSNGQQAVYPQGLNVYDEITVCSSIVASPNTPEAIGATKENFVSSPLYFESDIASNAGNLDNNDSGIASYFWDGLILNSTSNISRNNYSQNGLQLFKTAQVLNTQLNQDNLPIVFSTSTVQASWSPNFYRNFRTTTPFQLSATNNIFFFESYVNNYANSLNFINGQSFFYEINVTNSTGSTKYLRQQLAFDDTFKTLNIYTSIDDTTWSSDTTNVPSARYNLVSVTNPDIVAQITQSGIFCTLLEVLNETEKIFQAKLIFKPENSENNIVISDLIFTSSTLSTSLNLYGEFRFYIQNATYTVILESTQSGICQGTISAAVMPNDKINTDTKLLLQNDTSNFYNAQELKSWFTLNNSPSSGVTNNATVGGFPTVQFYNNQTNDPENNISAAEIQSSVPTFSDEVTITASFNLPTTNPNIINTAYSFDSDLSFDDFTFTDLLKTSGGVILPVSDSQYNYYSVINYSGSNQLLLNVTDVGLAQTCSFTTSVTDRLFFYSQSNTSGVLTPPFYVRTLNNLSTSATFSAWIGTNEPYNYSTSTLITNLITVQNAGNVPISISTGAGLGLNTINPGQPYVANLTSISSTTPNTFTIISSSVNVASSINFLYDFGQLGTISQLKLTVQIATPPECPATLPSFKYSVEVSDDFINWTYVSNVTGSDLFSPTTGNLELKFILNQTNVRFARLRLYYDIAVTFDPRETYKYSLMGGTITPNSLAANTGKFVLGFTDTSAKNSSLGQLYNQPTYMRQYLTNSSTFNAIVFDFSDFKTDVNGPVYLSILTNSGEKRFYTVNSGFNFGLNNTHSITFSIRKQNVKDAFYLKPSVVLNVNNTSNPLVFDLEEILTEPNDTQNLVFGYYPFFSLVGNGNISLRSSVIKGTYNTGLSYSKQKSYFSLLSSENVDYTASYGKNLIQQNTYGIATFNYPQVDTYFQYNTIKGFYYENITFIVKAVFTTPAGLFGPTFTDGVYLEACDYVLLTGQPDKSANGVYQVQTKQWVKKKANPSGLGKLEPTVLVSEGNVFSDTLWMQDIVSTEWVSNAVACPFVIDDNNLLFTGISSSYKYPRFIKLGVGVNGISQVSSLNQVKLKILNSPAGFIRETDLATQWNSVFQNGQLYELTEKSNSNNTIFMNFAISSSQIASISTSLFPATYNLLVTYSGNFIPAISQDSNFSLPSYGKDYRIFTNPSLIYQLFSTYETISIGSVSTSLVNTSVYGITVSDIRTPQTGFSTDYTLDNTPPTVGILSKVADNPKSVPLSISTAFDSGAGLSIARIIQKTPAGEIFYGAWFGFNTDSLSGIASVVAYPTFVPNQAGITTGEPLSGYYRYGLQVADKVGNISQTNQVENFYYESALIDTQGPSASVNFVNPDSFNLISFTTSNIVTTRLVAEDSLSDVKSFRYRILPNGEFGNWLDYSEFAQIFLPESIEDGILSIQFQFKDFGNNVLYSTATVANDQVYIYTWNIVSKLISNVLFTVTESTTFNNNPVLIVGASKANQATIYVWDNSKLIELVFPGFLGCKAITAILAVGDQVIIGTENGKTFVYQNGVFTGPFASFTWGGTPLPITKFEVHKYPEENVEYVYATTANIPRIFRTPSSNLKNLSWQVVQTPPISVEKITVVNSGLWSGNNFFYSISPSFVPASLTPVLSYGISSVIVSNTGSNINSIPNITVGGPMSGVGLNPVLQGYISKLNLLAGGVGYTAGATVTIQAPVAGGIQATGYAVTNPNGQIVSIGLNPGGQGYGYTSTNPSVIITGNLGIGSQAVASAVTQFDSIYSVSVSSAGIGTTTNVTLSAPGGAILTPDFLYRVSDIDIVNPGFGYTSSPEILVNGLSTIASASALYGSIQSITVTGSATTFSTLQTATVQTLGGVATNWLGTFSTSVISFSTGATNSSLGFVLNNIGLSQSGLGFGTFPSISFASSLSTTIYNPILKFTLSDDLTLYSGSGSIYDIKSYDNKLFFTSTNNGIVELGLSSGIFSASEIELTTSDNNFDTLSPYQLSVYKNNLYFSVIGQPFVGKLNKTSKEYIFQNYQDNTLLFKPYNFDILSNWQLKKIISKNGLGTATYGPSENTLLIYSQNAQVFYESTKDNTWFNRCTYSENYLVTLSFEAIEGTQSLEISTFTTTLKAAFTLDKEQSLLIISFGDKTYQQVTISEQVLYNISFIKNGSTLYIYSDLKLIQTSNNFFMTTSATPIIKFGYLFEPTTLVANNENINTFGLPSQINTSKFIWRQIKFSFNLENLDLDLESYSLNLPYVIPNATSVRVLKTLKNNLYAVTKSLSDTRFTSELPDVGSKVFRLESDTWNDVTGIFENYAVGVNTAYIITSPNDINNLNDSFFITGVTKPIVNRSGLTYSPNQTFTTLSVVPSPGGLATDTITLGLSTNILTEQKLDATLVILNPSSSTPSGQDVQVTSSNNLVTVPSPVYFPANSLVRVISLGVGSTSVATSAVITVTNGVTTSSSTVTVIPIGLSSFTINTSSFVAYSQDKVVANIRLSAPSQSPSTIIVSSSDSTLLSVPIGVVTVPAGQVGIITKLSVGVTTTRPKSITFSASYRGATGLATILAQPFVFNFSVNNQNFVGNQGVTTIGATASVNRSPIGILTVNLNSSNPSVLNVPSNAYIFPSAFSTTQQLTVGSAVTQNTNIFITASIPGTVSTSLSTAAPFTIVSSVSNHTNPVFGLQTATITFTINSAPLSNVTIRNIVTSLTINNLVFPSLSTVSAGSLTTSFGISTTRQYSQGLAVTVQGAPNGFNTSSALTLLNDSWRITNFTVSPDSIVGAGGNSDGTVQSLTLSATLNVGLATTVYITSSLNRIDVKNISFTTSSTGSATSVGYATGLSTTLITGFAITARGPFGITSTINNLTLNPFLISSVSTSYVWNGIQTNIPSYTVGGIGATIILTTTLNAYVLTGIQTIAFSSLSTFITRPNQATLGVASILAGSHTTSIILSANRVASGLTTNVTALLIGDGLGTAAVNIQPIPSFNAVFNPIISGQQSNIQLYPDSPLPVALGATVLYSNGVSGNFNIKANVRGISTYIPFTNFSLGTTFIAQVIALGSVQTYYVTGYSSSGAVYGVGYNYYGELSINYPVVGPLDGSSERVYMGLNDVVKVASGYHHNLALNSSGQVFSIGLNTYNQLGYNGISTNIFYSLGLPSTFLAKDIYAQRNTSYIITADNSLYSFGGNNNYALGTATISISTSTPYLISTSVQLFSAYEDNAAYVTYNNRTGTQSIFQFGAGRTQPIGFAITQLAVFGVARTISNLIIQNIDQGPNHTLASGSWSDGLSGITSSGVFAWGANDFYQTGYNTTFGISTVPNVLFGFSTSGTITRLQPNQHIAADYNFSLIESSYLPNNQGYVTSVIMNTFGLGFSTGATVTFSAPPASIIAETASGVALTNNLGYVSGYAIANEGSGYLTGAAVTFSPPTGVTSNPVTALGTAIVTANKVTAIDITNPGFGYTTPPLMIITPVGGGSGAVGVASVSIGQVTEIIVTNPGFGYTQSATVTISGLGFGATAYVNLASSARTITNLNLIGSAITSNSAGYGIGLAPTSIANTLQANTPDINVYKLIKNPNHYFYLNSNGVAIAAGGAASISAPIPLNVISQNVVYYAQNNNGLKYSELYSYSYSSSNGGVVTYNYSVFGHVFNATSAKPVHFVAQPELCLGAYEINSIGGFALVYDSDSNLTAYYYDTVYDVAESWNLGEFNSTVDLTISFADVILTDPRAKEVYLICLQTTASSGSTVNLFAGKSNNGIPQTLNTSPLVVYTSKSNATAIASCFLNHYRGATFTYGGFTYDWIKCDVNFAIGYQDGTIELYGNAFNSNIDGGILLITSWSPNGSKITDLTTIQDQQFPNQSYLFASTENGYLYSYTGDGDPLDTGYQTILTPGQSPRLLNTLQLDSIFGYIVLVQPYFPGIIMASTSENYVLLIQIQNLELISYVQVSTSSSDVINSITGTINPENANSAMLPSQTPVICITANSSSSNSVYAYYAPATKTYEIGADYANTAGAYQSFTVDGTVIGAPVSSIVDISTSDTFTIIVDSEG